MPWLGLCSPCLRILVQVAGVAVLARVGQWPGLRLGVGWACDQAALQGRVGPGLVNVVRRVATCVM